MNHRIAVLLLVTATAAACGHSSPKGVASSVAPTTSSTATSSAPPASPSGLNHVFVTTVNHSRNVAPGTKLLASGTGAERNTAFFCVLAAIRLVGNTSESAPDTSTLKSVKSDAEGHVECTEVYQPFKGTTAGHTHQCPPTASDAKLGWFCAIALADGPTIGATSESYVRFTPTR